MDFHRHGASPSSSTSSSSNHRPNLSSQNGHSSDPMHSWWESISKARSRIQLLSSILPSDSGDPLSSLADTDRPARSLLLSAAAYSSVSAALSSPSSGSGDDPLCHWFYDTYLSSDPDLRLIVLSYLPLLCSIYLHRIHHPASDDLISLSGFEAVLLAIYSSETKARNGKAVTVSIPDLSQPSLYHTPRNTVKSPNSNSKTSKPLVGVLSPPLEPQIAVKSTKRACIVGVTLDCYFQQISQIPSWSKVDFCKYATVWAGEDCPCTSEFGRKPEAIVENNGESESNNAFGSDITSGADEIENMAVRVNDLAVVDDHASEVVGKDARIPLPWELLQPVLRILGHCLLGPLNVDEVKDVASVAVRRLYARASHDLVPQAILASRSLIQLDKRAREAAKAATAAAANSAGSNANTPNVVRFNIGEQSGEGGFRTTGKKAAKQNKMSRKAKLNELRFYRLKAKKKMNSPNPEVRIRYKLEKAKRKEVWLIEKLRKYELPKALPETYDPEILTEEERFYLKRTGEKKKNYVPVGRRGVFGGVVLNMHLHWKKHETVKVTCKPCKPGQVNQFAEELARLSKGIIIDIKPNNTILFYRGKNYVQPDVMSPPDTLSKAKALEKYRYEQSLEHTSQFIEKLENELEEYHKHIARYKKDKNVALGELSVS